MTQPEALRLAEDLQLNHKFCPEDIHQQAAAELRRLHAENEALKQRLAMNEDIRIAQQDLIGALAEPDACTWYQDGDSESGVYGTSCGRYFNLEDGTPEDNKMQWCCYCGKKLAQELITEDEDD